VPIVGPFLTAAQIERVWIDAGGSPVTAEFMAAVAMAESSGGTRSYNVNTDGTTDYGIWQINSTNGGSEVLYEPDYGASIAKRLSNNGETATAWCTAYTDAACGHHGGHYDPTGSSPVGTALRTIRAGGVVPTPRGVGRAKRIAASDPVVVAASTATTLPQAWALLTKVLGKQVPTLARRTQNYARAIPKAASRNGAK